MKCRLTCLPVGATLCPERETDDQFSFANGQPTMDASPGPATFGYAFGPFVLDPVRRVLWRGRVMVPMTSKTFDVLLLLVENHGRLVSKDELFRRVWQDAAVQENNLVRQISMLRRALDERADQHDYIVTIPGQGYQFVAPVVAR